MRIIGTDAGADAPDRRGCRGTRSVPLNNSNNDNDDNSNTNDNS